MSPNWIHHRLTARLRPLAARAILLSSIALAPLAVAAEPYPCAGIFHYSPVLTVQSSAWKVESRVLESPSGPQVVYGASTALEAIKPDVLFAKPMKDILIPKSVPGIETAGAITGSITRTGALKIFGDVDMEALLVMRLDEGRYWSMSDPSSPEIQRLTAFFRTHLLETVASHPDILFVELKAGEYLDPETGELKGVKWSFDDLKKSVKTVVETKGTRTLTLAQALSEPARIKVDWAAPSIAADAAPGAYQEFTVLYRIGSRMGANQARLRYNREENREALPLRHVSVATSLKEAELQHEASQFEVSMPVEAVRRDMLMFTPEDLNANLIKFVKRVYSFMKFWPDFEGYRWVTGKELDRASLMKQAESLLTDPELMRLSKIRTQAKHFVEIAEHGLKIPGNRDAIWLASIGETRSMKEVAADYEARVQARVRALLGAAGELSHYVDYEVSRIPYAQGELTNAPLKIVAIPNQGWKMAYVSAVARWRSRYPSLHFAPAEKVKFLLVDLGQVTRTSLVALEDAVADAQLRIDGNSSLKLTATGFALSTDRSAVAMRYGYTNDKGFLMRDLRAQCIALGARPGFGETTNTIEVPFVSPALWDPEGAVQLGRFMRDEWLEAGLADVPLQLSLTDL